MATKIQPSYFFAARHGLLTGEETPLDMLLDNNALNYDIQQHINSFLEAEPDHTCEDPGAYIRFHDSLNNEFRYPVDPDEKHCFDILFEDDFAVNE